MIHFRLFSPRSRIMNQCVARKLSEKYILRSPYINDELTKIQRNSEISFPHFTMKSFLNDDVKNRIALVDGTANREISYENLYYSTFGFAKSLRKMGIGKNNCVAIISANHLHYFTSFHGVALTGAFTTTINPLYTATEIANIFEETNPVLIISHPNNIAVTKAALLTLKKNIPIISLEEKTDQSDYSIQELLQNQELTHDDINSFHVHPSSILTIPFSSGTTGKPKGVILTHNNLISNSLQVDQQEMNYLSKGNRIGVCICPLPFFHIYGMLTGLSAVVRTGSKLVFMSTFDLKIFLELVQNHKVNRAILVPPIILALAKHPMVDNYDLSSLESIMSGAAPLGAEIQIACGNRLKCVVKQGWGMTELSPVGTATGDEDVVPGSAGRLVAGSEAMIIDTITGESLPLNKEGELLYRGPNVMIGYYNNPEATKATIRPDGFLHTGDIGKFDENGNLFITDRSKELIKYKGFQVAPAELEAIIASMNDVIDVVVIPVLDDMAGEIPRAYVVKREGSSLTETDIMEYLVDKVSSHKKLRGGVIFTDKIPKSASGKLLRRVQIEIDRAKNLPTKLSV